MTIHDHLSIAEALAKSSNRIGPIELAIFADIVGELCAVLRRDNPEFDALNFIQNCRSK